MFNLSIKFHEKTNLIPYNSIPSTPNEAFWQKAKPDYPMYKHQRENLAATKHQTLVIENSNYFEFSRSLGEILWAMNFWLKPHFRGLILSLSLSSDINTMLNKTPPLCLTRIEAHKNIYGRVEQI